MCGSYLGGYSTHKYTKMNREERERERGVNL